MLDELVTMLNRDPGERFARNAVHRFFARRRITFKKDCALQRTGAASRGVPSPGPVRRPARPDPVRLIFMDESGANTKRAQLRGRTPHGERCSAAVPHGHWKTTTFVDTPRGRERVDWCFDLAATAYNLIRLPRLLTLAA